LACSLGCRHYATATFSGRVKYPAPGELEAEFLGRVGLRRGTSGRVVAYDGFGGDASANNTLFLHAWLAL
jgi:hypothetical protein